MADKKLQNLIEKANKAASKCVGAATGENFKNANKAVSTLEEYATTLGNAAQKQYKAALTEINNTLSQAEKATNAFLNHSVFSNDVNSKEVDALIQETKQKINQNQNQNKKDHDLQNRLNKLNDKKPLTKVQERQWNKDMEARLAKIKENSPAAPDPAKKASLDVRDKYVTDKSKELKQFVVKTSNAFQKAETKKEAQAVHKKATQDYKNIAPKVTKGSKGKEIHLPGITISGPPVDALDKKLGEVETWLKDTGKKVLNWAGEKTKQAITASAKFVVSSIAKGIKSLGTSLIKSMSSSKKEDPMLINANKVEIQDFKNKNNQENIQSETPSMKK